MISTYIRRMNLLKITTVILIATMFSACDDTYDKHYDPDNSIVADKNLWESLQEKPELSTFTSLLKEYKYDEILSQSQAYTVFAPNNEALANYDLSYSNIQKELIENHIARYFNPASGSLVKTIATLNNKRVDLSYYGSNYVYGSIPFYSLNTTVATNGLIHVLSGYEEFYPNIWEYLEKFDELEKLKDYMYSLDEVLFIPELSIPGSIVDGEQTYLDSVFVNNNKLLTKYGYINREDSLYIMLAPSNVAWDEAYERAMNYYVFYDKDQNKADSLQTVFTSEAVVQDLIFNVNEQGSMTDSLVSTSENVFHKPQYLFEGAKVQETSNGTLYITDLLKIDPINSYHQEIITEAELSKGRENTMSEAFMIRATGENLLTVSDGYYLRLTPTSSTGNPTGTFTINDNLSYYYDIYCVFVNKSILYPSTTTRFQENLVYFNVNYLDETGEEARVRFPTSGVDTVNTNVMDTVLIAKNFKFPVVNNSFVDIEEPSVTVKVFSNVARTQTTTYSRELLIDCILLRPTKGEEE